MDVLVDTTVWSIALRGRQNMLNLEERALKDELDTLILAGKARIGGPVRQEVLSGIRDPLAFEQLRNRLRAFPDLPLQTEDFEEAARCFKVCQAAGVAGSFVDFLVCATAMRRGLAVFSADPDFKRYARFLPLTLHSPRSVAG